MRREQTSVTPPFAGASQSDIIDAAEARAAFWKYPASGPWTVPVRTLAGEVQVIRDEHGQTQVSAPRKRAAA